MLLVFGGACHAPVAAASDDDDEEEVVYGDRVVDLGDVQLLDLQTHCWLPCDSEYSSLRGGVNALFRIGETVYVSGGMHSDPGARMPTWTGELAETAAVLPAVAAWQRGCAADA